MSKLLITGFEPFGGEKINPSQKIAEALASDPDLKDKILTRILPVSFERAFPALREAMKSGNEFDAVLMFGQASGRPKISLERVALNWIETQSEDEDGTRPAAGRIKAESDEAIFSRLPLTDWKQKIEEEGIPCEISLTAGGFVCNKLYFQVAELFQNSHLKSLFVHVPYLPDQAKDGKPSMDLSQMVKAAKIIATEMSNLSAAPQ